MCEGEVISILIYHASFRGIEPDAKVIAENVEKLTAKLDGYEAILKKQKYLAGEVSFSAIHSSGPMFNCIPSRAT